MGFLQGIISGAGKGLLEGAKGIIEKFKADPTKVAELDAELKKLELTHAAEMARLEVQVEEIYARQVESVNQTMREEAKSEHWMQWSWRPSVGFLFVLIGLNNYVVLPYLKKQGLQPIEIPSEMFMAILAILGVASWHRGQRKVKEAPPGK